MIRLTSGHYLSPVGAQRRVAAAALVETTYTAGMHLPRHTHEFPYMVLIVDGVLRERTRGRIHDLGRGWLVYNDAGESHENHLLHGRARCLNVELLPRFVQRLADEGLRAGESVVYTHAGAALGAICRLYAATLDPGPELEVEEALVQIFAAVHRPRNTRQRGAPWVARVVEALHDAVPARPSLAELADLAGVQQVHLCRGFRAAVGSTIGEYVRRLRIAGALSAVTGAHSPPPSIAAVALAAGFADQPHMTRAFSSELGRTPSRLSRAARARTFRSRHANSAVLH